MAHTVVLGGLGDWAHFMFLGKVLRNWADSYFG